MKLQDFLDVSASTDYRTLERRLVGFAEALGFGRVSATAVTVGAAGKTRFDFVGNTPDAYVTAFSERDLGRRCPVMQWLRTSHCPLTYDQSTYVQAGAADLWEQQAPFGYRFGVAAALHLPGGRHYAIGMDRDEPLPAGDEERTRLMADLMLLASLTMDTAFATLVDSDTDTRRLPKLTAREMEILKWTLEGKSSWVVGEILHLGQGTVNFHLRNAMRKLDASSKHVAAMRALRMGLIGP